MRVANVSKRLGLSEAVVWAFFSFVAVLAASMLWLGGSAVARCAEAARSERAANRDFAVVATLRGREVAPTGTEVVPTTLGGAGEFQSFVEDEAGRRNCSVAEFQASPDSQPFISRFDKAGVTGSWTQVDVMFCVEGRLPDVYATVAAVSQQSVAFEPTAVQFTRLLLSDAGSASVAARVQGRVVQLGRGAK